MEGCTRQVKEGGVLEHGRDVKEAHWGVIPPCLSDTHSSRLGSRVKG